MISGVSQGASFTVIMFKKDKNKLCFRKESSFPVPLEFFDVVRRTHMTLDVLQTCRIDDYWNVDGDRILLRQWTRFTPCTLLNHNPPRGYTSSRKRLTKIQATSRPENVWPERWSGVSKKS